MNEITMEFIIVLIVVSIPLILVISTLILVIHDIRSEKRFDDWFYGRHNDE